MGGVASISPPSKTRPFSLFIHSYTRWVYDKWRFGVRYIKCVQTINTYIFRLNDPQKRAIPLTPSAFGARAGRNISLLFSFYLFLYCRYCTISFIYLLYNNSKKTCDISNKDIYYIYNKSTWTCTIRIYFLLNKGINLKYMSLMIHINYYNILIIKRTICP